MKRRRTDGSVVDDGTQSRSVRLSVRVTPQERDKIALLMENNGYLSLSDFLRDLLFRKRIESRRVVVRLTDKALRDRLNQLIYQIRRIGVNYNQFVALYQRQSALRRPDGTPVLNTRALDARMERLRGETESLRDEVSVAIDLFRRYADGGPSASDTNLKTHSSCKD